MSAFNLWARYVAIRHARFGNRRAHEGVILNLAFWSLGVAGTLAFMPGRLMRESSLMGAKISVSRWF